jgi:hypothetical protein
VSTCGVVVLRLAGVHDWVEAVVFVVFVDVEEPQAARAMAQPKVAARIGNRVRIGG